VQKSTIQLTNTELEFISNPEIMQLKQKLIRKYSTYLMEIGEYLKATYFANQPMPVKLTRGENYLEQPYLVLDVPQLKKEDLTNKLRIMFWWGNYISLQYFIKSEAIDHIDGNEQLFVLIGDDLFDNDLQSNNFISINQFKQNPALLPPLSKLAKKVSFDDSASLLHKTIDFLEMVQHKKSHP
jgi:hypothetical protein